MNLEESIEPTTSEASASKYQLKDGSRIAVIGGGPAGAFFSYFLLEMAARMHLELEVVIYEPRQFTRKAPQGCNMCGGIISESLVQYLSAEGIILPADVVQRGINAYNMHMDVGSRAISTPSLEKCIAAVIRGGGPRLVKDIHYNSFDDFLLRLAVEKGAEVVHQRVSEVNWEAGKPQLKVRGAEPAAYDLVVVAAGVNSAVASLFKNAAFTYQPPGTTKTAIREYYLGEDVVNQYLGDAMHVFLLDLPRLEFAALIPKGDFVTVCMLGESIDNDLLRDFLNTPQVKACLPPDWQPDHLACSCMPRITMSGSARPFDDRVVFVGDCGVSRLYKDGIGAAYRTAKAAAKTALFHGVSAADFREQFWPTCRAIENDNRIGKLIFIVVRVIQRFRLIRRGVLRMVAHEQDEAGTRGRMSEVLWDTFTGSAPYREVFKRTLHPAFLGGFVWYIIKSLGNKGTYEEV